jgi:HEPN domain-containing protein
MAQKVIRAKIGPRGAGPVDPHQLFINADNFRHTAETLVQLPGDVRFAQSLLVLAAFASELFLKCILVIEQAQCPRGHDLGNLYSKVSGAVKAKLEQRWNTDFVAKRKEQLAVVEKEYGVSIPRDLKNLLSLGARSFEHIRYAHEKQPVGNFYLMDFPALLRTIVVEIKPAWA